MKVFKFESAETDYVAAEDREQAVKYYADMTSDSEEGVEGSCEISEVPDEEWEGYNIVDPDKVDAEGEYRVMGTIADAMRETTEPTILCSTAY